MLPLSETIESGFRLYGMRSPEVELLCCPELGGRVCSLVSRRSGREWLWRRPEAPWLFRPSDPADFGTGCFAGLDECLPTVGACRWDGAWALPDHGQLWARPWKIEPRNGPGLDLRTEIPEWGLWYGRRMTLEGGTLRFEYLLENSGEAPAPALWAQHPLFALAEGDRLELPAGLTELRLEASDPPLPERGPGRVGFPEIAPGVRLDRLELPDLHRGRAKAFAGPWNGPACAALANPATGDRIEVRWDGAALPYLGLWLTRGGYRGWHHAALEPTNAPYDRADRAAADPACAAAASLAPGAQRRWWVEWRVG